MNQQKPQTPTLRIPGKSSEHLLFGTRILGKISTVILLLLVFEYLCGHPYIRAHWSGYSSDPQNMVYCRLYTISGEQQEVYAYMPLIGFTEPEHSYIRAAFNKIGQLFGDD